MSKSRDDDDIELYCRARRLPLFSYKDERVSSQRLFFQAIKSFDDVVTRDQIDDASVFIRHIMDCIRLFSCCCCCCLLWDYGRQ